MTGSDHTGSTGLFAGASRGLGGAVAPALHVAAAQVAAVAAYARRDGIGVKEYPTRFGPSLRPEEVGKANGRRGGLAHVGAEGVPADGRRAVTPRMNASVPRLAR